MAFESEDIRRHFAEETSSEDITNEVILTDLQQLHKESNSSESSHNHGYLYDSTMPNWHTCHLAECKEQLTKWRKRFCCKEHKEKAASRRKSKAESAERRVRKYEREMRKRLKRYAAEDGTPRSKRKNKYER